MPALYFSNYPRPFNWVQLDQFAITGNSRVLNIAINDIIDSGCWHQDHFPRAWNMFNLSVFQENLLVGEATA
jgi:hypothetical protein